MIDNKTQRLALPLPNVDNYLEDDVTRLSEALQILDAKVATVGDDGKIPVAQIPAVALTDTFPVNSETAMLSLEAQPGDIAIRNDLSKSFILMAAPATMLGNWKEIVNDALVQLGKDDGASLIVMRRGSLANAVKTSLLAYYGTTPINAVSDYGLVADFDPSIGLANGTNNTSALQKLLDDVAAYVSTGKSATVVIPAGKYYFNFDGSTNPGGVGVMWGRVGAGLKNVKFIAYGAEFYSGSVGRMNGIFDAKYGVEIIGLKVVGFAGGTLASSRERDALFSLAYNCHGVTFDDVDLSNSLGDCIYLGGDLNNGAITGKFCKDITIRNSLLRERYGNGIRSYNLGTRSRLAIAIIDCVGLKVENCTIIGGIDLEPNADNQRLQHINIQNIHFSSGPVTPDTGTNPWAGESIGGTQVVRGKIRVQSRASEIIAQEINIRNITGDYLYIRATNAGLPDVLIDGVAAYRGLLNIGHYSGTNSNPGATVSNVRFRKSFNGSDDDIYEYKGTATTPEAVPAVAVMLEGNVTYAQFSNISVGGADGGFSYLFYAKPVAGQTTGDGGRCIYQDCVIRGNGALFNYTPPESSNVDGNIMMPTSGIAIPEYRRLSTDLVIPSVKTLTVASSGAIDWNGFKSGKVAVTASVAGIQISGIANGPAIGAEVQIRNAGSNSITLAHSSAFYLKGTTSAVLDDTRKVVTFQYIASGVWTEIYRNF